MLQEAYLAACDAAKKYDPKRSDDPGKLIRTWAFYAARRAALREARYQTRYITPGDKWVFEEGET